MKQRTLGTGLTVSEIGWPHRLARRRLLMAGIVVVAFFVAASPLAGPEGLTPALRL